MNWAQVQEGRLGGAFEEWIGEAEWKLSADANRLTVANDGGEVRYYVGWDEYSFVLTRAERASDEKFVMSAGSLVDIERYLTARVGYELRQLRSDPWIWIPFDSSDVAAGFQLVQYGTATSGLKRVTGEVLDVRWRDSMVHPAVEFSYYADAEPADIRRSFDSPDGGPLFAEFVKER
jgi:hypothetical protein